MNRILSTAIAAAIAVTTLGASVPAMSAPLAPAAPAVAHAADSSLVEVKHGGKHKWGKGKHKQTGFGFHLHLGVPYGSTYPAWCYQKRKAWIPGLGLRVRYVNVCH